MQCLQQIRAAFQTKILAQHPGLGADAIEPYSRLMCRHALRLAAQDADAIESDPDRRHEHDVMKAIFAEEMDALRDALPHVANRLEAQTGDDKRRATLLAIQTMDAFINGGNRTPPLSLKAIRARVDVGSYLLSQWDRHDKELPAYRYWQHRLMVWLLVGEFEAPGVLSPFAPEHPEHTAEMCEQLFSVEIAALKDLTEAKLRRAVQRSDTEARAMTEMEAVLDALQRQFVGDALEPPADWLAQ